MPNAKRKIVYDYYLVDVPGDCADSIEELGQQAIRDAEERTRLYCMPATWIAKHIGGEVGNWYVRFRVCRMRNRVERKVKS
jgi:hypothetical protein